MASPLVTPKQLANAKANNDFAIEPRTYYAGMQIKVPFSEVALYSTNIALFFYIGANCYACYLMNQYHGNEKYIVYGLALYVIQIVYNFLDLNSTTNINRLEKLTGA